MGKPETVELRHARVEQNQRVRLADDGSALHLRQCLQAVLHQHGVHEPAVQDLGQYEPVGAIVIHHQNRHIVQDLQPPRHWHGLVLGQGKPCREMENRSFSRLAFHPHIAAHQLYELRNDCQTQAGAPVTAGSRGIALYESVENMEPLFGGHANARIGYAEMKHGMAVCTGFLLNPNGHFPLFGKFEGVARQIHDYLRQTARIAQQDRGYIRCNLISQLQPFFVGAGGKRFQGIAERLPQIEFDAIELQLAGFHFGKIQDVIQKLQQRIGRGLYQGHEFMLLCG